MLKLFVLHKLSFLGSVTSAEDITPEERVAVIDQDIDINLYQ